VAHGNAQPRVEAGMDLNGAIPANLLPFRDDLSIDEEAYRKHLHTLATTPGVVGVT
jgi:4-hydroxy-tetrahydrodipicolinate synthase